MKPPRSGVRAIILDFDGVVLETDFPWMRAWQAEFEALGVPLSISDWASYVGADESTSDPRDLLRARGAQLSDDHADALMKSAVATATAIIQKAQPRRGLIRLLRQAQRAEIPVVIATNGDGLWLETWMPKSLVGLVAFGVTKDDVARPKPAPEMPRLALERLGLDPDTDAAHCVGIEDSPIGVSAVLAAGMHCLYVPTRLSRTAKAPGALRAGGLHQVSIASLDGLVSRAYSPSLTVGL